MVTHNATPDTINWRTQRSLQRFLKGLREQLGSQSYRRNVQSLREFLCHYFNADDCINKTGSISPIGSTPRGGKKLKVRWGLPGAGKSSSLRLVFVAFCDERQVVLVEGSMRRDKR